MKKDSGEISVRGFTEALQEVVDAESEMDYRYDKAEKSQKWVDEGEKKVINCEFIYSMTCFNYNI
jgi:hypothetical protein